MRELFLSSQNDRTTCYNLMNLFDEDFGALADNGWEMLPPQPAGSPWGRGVEQSPRVPPAKTKQNEMI